MTNIGILGGGQLARMLALSAHPLGLKVAVLAADANEPAAQVVGSSKIGALTDAETLRRFLAPLDHVTFESEFVDVGLMKRALPARCHTFPALAAMETIQDRLTQKQLLNDYKIPTSPWVKVSTLDELHAAADKFSLGFVLKQRRFGYDGYGTFVVRSKKELTESVLTKSRFGFIAEEFIGFKRELAVSFVRSTRREFRMLPLVESVQQDSRCFSVHGPVRHRQLSTLKNSFKRLMQDLDYCGVLAVEIFETSRGLMVNELAPRVHNSAHYSQNGLTTSQFEYHLRAGLGLPLPEVELVRPGFAMVNLLGQGNQEIKLSYSDVGHLHWYGKSENRPGRKLGHLNVTGASGKRALQQALKWRKEFIL